MGILKGRVPKRRKKMKILIDREKCDGCKVCTRVCPQMILKSDGETCTVSDIDRCMGCFGCEEECKKGAIRLIKAPRNVKDIEIEPLEEGIKQCDVAVVGAGPAGLGAAITCARAGLNVVVFDKLPNRKTLHHNDGGIMFTLPGVASIEHQNGRIEMPEIDIALKGDVAKKIDFIGLLGTDGLSTQSDFPDDIDGYIQNKVLFVENLANLAEEAGARMMYNTKVVDVLKQADVVRGIKLDSGEEILSKVVVTADGIFAKITEKAGFEVSNKAPFYLSGIRYEFEKEDQSHPLGYTYIHGGLEPEEAMGKGYVTTQASISITDKVHIAIGFLSKSKYYPAPKPLDHYVEKLIRDDKRVKDLFGNAYLGKKPDVILGFRTKFRKEYLKDTVLNGAIAVGDAWVDDSDLGNIPALSNGVFAGRVIVDAALKNDFSKQALNPANRFVSESVLRYIASSKKEKLSGTILSPKEMALWFKFLPHFDFPAMTFGNPAQQARAMEKFVKESAELLPLLEAHPQLKSFVL